jgi:TonB-dependent receptor
MEEIVVTGIRGSMQQSLERKRNADHFVDAITAEDIGSFPDQNLAESLQRLGGVAIDRKNGEGSFVSVRGLGPQFVLTTVHGRAIPSNADAGQNDGLGQANRGTRATAFDKFQAGLVQAVEVHKSPRADHVEGGLGGFIDIQPRKPLDLGKQVWGIAADATMNQLSDDTGPGIFGMYSNVLSDNLGFMVSAQMDNKYNRSDMLRGEHWGGLRTIPNGGDPVQATYLRHLVGELHTTDRDRLNISSALQFRASDQLEMMVDVLYTETSTYEQAFWESYRLRFGEANFTNLTVIDDNGTPHLSSYDATGGVRLFLLNADEQMDTETTNIGFNLKFQASDRLALNFDAQISETDSPSSNREALVRNDNVQASYNKYGPDGFPTLTTTTDVSDPAGVITHIQRAQTHLVDDSQSQVRFDVTYDIDSGWLQSVQAGVRAYRQERGDNHRYLAARAFRGNPVTDIGTTTLPVNDFLSGTGVTVYPEPAVQADLDAYYQTFFTRADEILAGGCFNTGTECSINGFSDGKFNEDLTHNDDGNALYAMVTFGGEIGDTPVSGNFGVRYVDNSTRSDGEQAEPALDFTDPANPVLVQTAPEFLSESHDYTEVLPSLNLRFDPRDDMVIRFSWAKVMSRPSFLDLNPRLTVQPNNLSTRGGNGTLDPTTATQIDLAFEWYFADFSIAQVGFFSKDIEAFIQPDFEDVTYAGITDPNTGLPLVLTSARPLNSGKSDLTGLELSYQTTFDNLPAPFDGFGVNANYTYIDSGSDFTNDSTGTSYTIPGLSENTINFTLFYDKGPYSGRLSYNFRDDFLDRISDFQGNPTFVDEYDQWDASFGYAFNDKLKFSFEAINMTDNSVRYYYNVLTGVQEHYQGMQHTGRRFEFGVRYSVN